MNIIPLKNVSPAMERGKESGSLIICHSLSAGFSGTGSGPGGKQRNHQFMLALDVSEIHGYRADLGLAGI